MRRISDEERALFLSALSGRLPAKRSRSAAKPKQAHAAHQSVKTTTVGDQERFAHGRRHTTQEEMDLFFFAVTGRSSLSEPRKPAKSKAITAAPVPKPTKPTVGLDGNTLRRLTRGELAPTAKLDLHGMTESAAHGALTAFVLAAHRRGDRLVLIVTGKGSAGGEGPRGVLKQMVPRWLDEAPMARIIAEKRWAHRRHGGDGALYVYLRKR